MAFKRPPETLEVLHAWPCQPSECVHGKAARVGRPQDNVAGVVASPLNQLLIEPGSINSIETAPISRNTTDG